MIPSSCRFERQKIISFGDFGCTPCVQSISPAPNSELIIYHLLFSAQHPSSVVASSRKIRTMTAPLRASLERPSHCHAEVRSHRSIPVASATKHRARRVRREGAPAQVLLADVALYTRKTLTWDILQSRATFFIPSTPSRFPLPRTQPRTFVSKSGKILAKFYASAKLCL